MTEKKDMTLEEQQKLMDICSKQADQYLQHIRPLFANRESDYGSVWAIENYMRMSLLPGIFVLRQSLSDEAIKEFIPTLQKLILEFKLITQENKEGNNEI